MPPALCQPAAYDRGRARVAVCLKLLTRNAAIYAADRVVNTPSEPPHRGVALQVENMSNSAPPPTSSPRPSPVSRATDAVLDRLLFLARYHGRSFDAEQLTGGVPLPAGRVTVDELPECAGRAGLAATSRVRMR